MTNLAHIRERLQLHTPDALPDLDGDIRRAAVALILRESDDATAEVLFIKRAERNGDPWSGHMAFPGGHADDTDDSLVATAMRETLEEIGLDLQQYGQPLGLVSHQHAIPIARPRGMLVATYAFHLRETPAMVLNHEVAEVVWSPLAPLIHGEQHTQQHRVSRMGDGDVPGYLLPGGHFVWGMTYRMLHTFFPVIHPQWQPPHR